MPEQFYWRHARESLLTDAAIRMFQLLAGHDGAVFDDVKVIIDDDYRVAIGSNANSRHGGIIQSQIQVFREAGCATKEKCVSVEMLSDNSRMNFTTPGTSWFAITLGSANLEGKNHYKSCPTGATDPAWMQTSSPLAGP